MINPDSPDSAQKYPESNLSLVKSSVHIMVAQGLGILGGLGFDVLTAATFGAGRQMDAFFVSLTIPQILISVVISNSIRVLSPIFTESQAKGDDQELQKLFSEILSMVGLITLGIVVIGFILSEGLIFIQSPGLLPESQALAVRVFRVLLINLFLSIIVEPFRAVLVYQRRLFLASLANFFRFTTALTVLFIFRNNFGIMALAWAYVSGGLVQVLVFSTAYFVLGGTYRPIFRIRSETIQLLSGRLGPPMLGELIGQSNVLAERFFASFLPPGVISALGYGRRILVALNGLINNSVSVAILPRISQEAVTEDLPKLRETVIFSTKLITFPTGLAAITIVGFSHPLVKLLFERGAFDLLAANNTAVILSIFAPSIIILGLTQLVMVPFFALGETKIIFIYRVLFLIVNLILDAILIFFFGGFGLAAALPISLLIVLVIWIITLARRLNGLGNEIYPFLLKFSTILALVLSVVYLIGLYLQTIHDINQLILWSVGVVALGIIVFLGLSWGGGLFRIKNYMSIISSFTNSLKRQ